MASKIGEEDDADFHAEDDEEDDFVPGAEEEEEEEDQESFRGVIQVDESGKLLLKGEGFQLQSTEKYQLGQELLVVGPWQLASANPKLKAPPRRVRVTISTANSKGKREDSTEEESYEMYGIEEADGDCLQFSGPVTMGQEFCVPLRQIRNLRDAAAPAAAAAASIPKPEDEDDEEDYDAVDFDELAALHADAQISVDAVLQKRYRESDEKETAANKRGKAETDDDEDVEF